MTSPSKNKDVAASVQLMRATSEGDLSSVNELLAAGADVNFANQAGQSVLIVAAVLGHQKIAERLLEAGADPNLRDRLGLTACEWSKRRGFSEISQLISKFSAPTTAPEAAKVPTSDKGNIETSFGVDRSSVPPELSRDTQSQSPSPTPDAIEAVTDERQVATPQSEPVEATISTKETEEPAAIAHDDISYPSPVETIESPLPYLALDSQPKSEPLMPPAVNVASTGSTQTEDSTKLPSAIVQPVPTEDVVDIDEAETLTGQHAKVDVEDDTAIKSGDVAPPTPEPPPAPPVSRFETTEREPPFRASSLGLSEPTASLSSKRCPKCNTIYENTSQLFCTRDRTALVRNELPPAAVSEASTPIAVWLLIAFVLGASAFGAYRLTQYLFRTEAPLPIAASPAQPKPVEVKEPFFSIGGDLAGTETNIPEPEYPADAQTAGIAGPITVRIRVNRNGRVISAATTSGDRRLRAAAVKAARQATFAPDKLAQLDRRSRVVAGTITYKFVPSAPAAAPAPSATENTVASDTSTAPSNIDPNAPAVSAELIRAAVNVPNAEYPERIKRAGIEGTITVTVRVNRAGKVVSWRSSSGNSQLRAAAIKAARKATFSPERLPGKSDVLGTITYNFTPSGRTQ